jgi:hypothetical protein
MQLESNQSAATFKIHLSAAAADALLLRDSVKMGFQSVRLFIVATCLTA